MELAAHAVRGLGRSALAAYVEESADRMSEEHARAALENRFCTADICTIIGQNPRLTSFYSVRMRLVAHRLTPQHLALKYVPHLYWSDLLRLGREVRIPAPVRRAINQQMLTRMPSLTLGERMTTARSGSREVAQTLLLDDDLRVVQAALINARLTEDDVLALIAWARVTPDHLGLVAEAHRWSTRYPIRRALAMNQLTPKAVAASQLRHLTRADRNAIWSHPRTSVFLMRCIERLEADAHHLRESSRREAPTAQANQHRHSHSMVLGGFDETS